MGAQVATDGNHVRVWSGSVQSLTGTSIVASPHPGFPTDLQQPFTSLLTMVHGTNTIHDSVYEGRFGHIPYLTKMGANIKVEGSVTIVSGVSALSGADVKATDLRAGAALVVAGLAATGQTRIFDIHHIERGYQDLCLRLRQLGARCWKVNIGNADSVVME